MWAIFGPAVGWSFIGIGLFAWRRRPDSGTGELMVLLGFAWFLSALAFANSPLLYSFGSWSSAACGAGSSCSSSELPVRPARARLGQGARRRGLRDLHRRLRFRRCWSRVRTSWDATPARPTSCSSTATPTSRTPPWASGPLYVVLFVDRARPPDHALAAHPPLERLQLTPVYVCGLLTFLLVDGRHAGAGDAAGWAVFTATALLPFAFLAGLLRSHVARLDARAARPARGAARLARAARGGQRHRAPPAGAQPARRRPGTAGGPRHAARPRAQARGHRPGEVATHPRPRAGRAQGQPGRAARARARHPPGGAHRRGLEPALHALAARAPVPVTLETDGGSACPPTSRSPPTSSSPRRWRTSPSTPRRRRPRSRSAGRTAA